MAATATKPPRTWPDLLLFAAAALLLYTGWIDRHDSWLTAEYGAGYALGIVGGGMMLALLLYPLRKKARWMQRLGPVTAWFRAHMWFGVLGPVAVLYHANFNLGSLNSNVALFAMGAVALSGLVGRYFYTKVHRTLYTQRLSLAELRKELGDARADLQATLARAPEVETALRQMETLALAPSTGIFPAWLRTWRLRFLAVGTHRILVAACAAHPLSEAEQLEAHRFLRAHGRILNRIAELALYDRLLSLWHLLHLPLFVLLVVAGWVHVLAVHMY